MSEGAIAQADENSATIFAFEVTDSGSQPISASRALPGLEMAITIAVELRADRRLIDKCLGTW